MKKALFIVLILLMVGGMAFAQEWGGLVKWRASQSIVSLVFGYIDIDVAWVPYVTENIGIPIDFDLEFFTDATVIQLLTGIEFIPLHSKEKNGLFLTLLGGVSLFFLDNGKVYPLFSFRANIGYQIVTDRGFVFTPGIGYRFPISGPLVVDLMLDIGFAYRKRS